MEVRFISNKPWVDETIRLRKALYFTTIFMVLLGVILGILGVVLLAYMEFVVGVIAIAFGILLPVGYVGANIALFAKRRKEFDKSMIIEYKFDEKGVTITKVSDTYKAKNVIDYVNLKLSKVYNKSRFIMLKTKSYYSDMIALRKSDIVTHEGENKDAILVKFINFLMAKLAESTLADEVTTSEENEINGQNSVSHLQFEDLSPKDDNVDIDDERQDADDNNGSVKFEVIEENVDDEYNDNETNKELFNYDKNLVDVEEKVPNVKEDEDKSFLYDYSSDDSDDGNK